MGDLTNLVYTPGTMWAKAHDPDGNMVAIDASITAGESNAADIGTNTADIGTNTADIGTNTADIGTNTADIGTNTADIATLVEEVDTGVIGQARLIFTAQPAIGNTIGIGADTYEFDGVGVNINVPIGLDAATTQASLIDAINTSGTEAVLAEADAVLATTVVIYNADLPGGTPEIGTQSIALTEAITDAADIWDQTNLDTTGRTRFTYRTSGTLVIDAVNVLTPVHLTLPFPPTELEWFAKDAAGAYIPGTTATFSIVAGQLVLDAAAGGAPLIATDLAFWAARG